MELEEKVNYPLPLLVGGGVSSSSGFFSIDLTSNGVTVEYGINILARERGNQ